MFAFWSFAFQVEQFNLLEMDLGGHGGTGISSPLFSLDNRLSVHQMFNNQWQSANVIPLLKTLHNSFQCLCLLGWFPHQEYLFFQRRYLEPGLVWPWYNCLRSFPEPRWEVHGNSLQVGSVLPHTYRIGLAKKFVQKTHLNFFFASPIQGQPPELGKSCRKPRDLYAYLGHKNDWLLKFTPSSWRTVPISRRGWGGMLVAACYVTMFENTEGHT